MTFPAEPQDCTHDVLIHCVASGLAGIILMLIMTFLYRKVCACEDRLTEQVPYTCPRRCSQDTHSVFYCQSAQDIAHPPAYQSLNVEQGTRPTNNTIRTIGHEQHHHSPTVSHRHCSHTRLGTSHRSFDAAGSDTPRSTTNSNPPQSVRLVTSQSMLSTTNNTPQSVRLGSSTSSVPSVNLCSHTGNHVDRLLVPDRQATRENSPPTPSTALQVVEGEQDLRGVYNRGFQEYTSAAHTHNPSGRLESVCAGTQTSAINISQLSVQELLGTGQLSLSSHATPGVSGNTTTDFPGQSPASSNWQLEPSRPHNLEVSNNTSEHISMSNAVIALRNVDRLDTTDDIMPGTDSLADCLNNAPNLGSCSFSSEIERDQTSIKTLESGPFRSQLGAALSCTGPNLMLEQDEKLKREKNLGSLIQPTDDDDYQIGPLAFNKQELLMFREPAPEVKQSLYRYFPFNIQVFPI